MFCSKCGAKLEKGISFCSSCGRSVKAVSSKESEKGTSLASKVSFSLPNLKKFFIVIPIIGAILLGIFLGKPVFQKIGGKLQGNSFSIFEKIETRYLKEAKAQAAGWSSQAKVYFFMAGLNKMDQAFPNVNYAFFASDKTKEFSYERFADGRVAANEDENIYNTGKEIISFPKMSAREAIRLGIKYFSKGKAANQKIEQLNVSIFELNNFWRVILYVNDGAKMLKSIECRVYFDKKVECDPPKETNFPSMPSSTQSTGSQEKVTFPNLKDIEYKYLVMAKGLAGTWSNNAFLCNFYISLSDPEDSQPYHTFTFCAPGKKTVYETTYSTYNKFAGEGKEKENEREYKKQIPSFYPAVQAQEAAELAVNTYNSIKPAGTIVISLSLILREEDDHWWVSLSTINSSGEKKSSYCYVYFDKRVECKD